MGPRFNQQADRKAAWISGLFDLGIPTIQHNYSDEAGIPAFLQKHPLGLHGLSGRTLQAVVAACSAV